MKSKARQRMVLVLFIVYCLDLAWKLAHWAAYARALEWWMIALALAVRFAFMAFMLSVLLQYRNDRPESK
jgi:hypothetical protein